MILDAESVISWNFVQKFDSKMYTIALDLRSFRIQYVIITVIRIPVATCKNASCHATLKAVNVLGTRTNYR